MRTVIEEGERGGEAKYVQSENLWSKTRLDVVSFALPCITSDDGEVLTRDCEDGPSVLRVWVEAAFRGHLDVASTRNGK